MTRMRFLQLLAMSATNEYWPEGRYCGKFWHVQGEGAVPATAPEFPPMTAFMEFIKKGGVRNAAYPPPPHGDADLYEQFKEGDGTASLELKVANATLHKFNTSRPTAAPILLNMQADGRNRTQ